jgi:hypothetical protein
VLVAIARAVADPETSRTAFPAAKTSFQLEHPLSSRDTPTTMVVSPMLCFMIFEIEILI